MLTLEELRDRLKAVAASKSDVVARLAHARYAGFRVREMEREIEEAARTRRAPAHSVEEAAALREVSGIVEELQSSLEDLERKEARQKATEEAKALEEVAVWARRRLSEVDGTEEAAREETRRKIFESV